MGNRSKTQPKRKRQQLSSAPKAKPKMGRPRSAQSNKFANWLDANPLTSHEVAEKLSVSVQHVLKLRGAVSRPSRDLAVAIEEMTDGMVPVSCWS